jgi:hypothetical protein
MPPPPADRETSSKTRTRYDQKRKIGEYRTWAAVERAIQRYGDEWLRDGATPKRKKRTRQT